jgi:glycosyltransferase involved in cell wall biosynthesis
MDRHTLQVTCVIPAFNEENTVGGIVSEAFKYCKRVLVIDDGSQDQTAAVSLQAGATVIRHVIRLGAGGALSTGLKAALKTDCEALLTMDADGQHRPEEIPILLDPIMKRQADIVIGSRFIRRTSPMPLMKRMGNRALSIAASVAAGVKITDSQSGFRAYRREVLEYVIHRAWDYRWASEILVLASKRNFKIKEVPITTVYLPKRREGAGIKDGFRILYSTIRGARNTTGMTHANPKASADPANGR